MSVVAFQHSSARDLPAKDKQQLVQLGFESRMLDGCYDDDQARGSGHPVPEGTTGVNSGTERAAANPVEKDIGPPRVVQDDKVKVICCPAKKIDRVILELCTGVNSRIGQRHKWSEGCLVVRITEDDDLFPQRHSEGP